MGIPKALFFGRNKNGHRKRRNRQIHDVFQNPKKKPIDLRPKKFTVSFEWRQVGAFIKKHFVLSGTFSILVIVGLLVWWPFSGKASIATFYPSNCLGGWENVFNAEGEPNLSRNDPSLFNEHNSAYLKNRISQMFCGGFRGTLPQGSKPNMIVLHISWAVGNAALGTSSAATTLASSTERALSDEENIFIKKMSDGLKDAENSLSKKIEDISKKS